MDYTPTISRGGDSLTSLDVQRIVPPYLYLPCTIGETEDDFEPEIRQVAAGPGLIAYTSLDRLRRAWGDDQEWAVVPLPVMSELAEQRSIEALLLDDGLRDEERSFDR